MIKNTEADFIEVFATAAGTVYQSDRLNCLLLEFAGKRYQLSYQNLTQLKKVIDGMDIEFLCTHTLHADLEIFFVRHHCFILSGVQILALKELLQGTFTMFRLNHILNDCLNRLVTV